VLAGRPRPLTFHRELHENGQIVLRLALTAKCSDDGGIGGVTEEFVRLCVQLTGARSARARIDLREVACDPSAVRKASPDARDDVTVTVPLED
jgi:hypothetical protein